MGGVGDSDDTALAETTNRLFKAEVTVSLEGGATINGVGIVTTDIETLNGVIHIIDAVLMPPM